MTKRRTAKVKGSKFEYDCQYSLSALFPDIKLTKELGFQKQYDLENEEFVFECKRHKAFSWNEMIKLLEKLESVKPKNKLCALLLKANRQPCLVMARDNESDIVVVTTFEYFFNIPFLDHPSAR